jgi:hypothetical protein
MSMTNPAHSAARLTLVANRPAIDPDRVYSDGRTGKARTAFLVGAAWSAHLDGRTGKARTAFLVGAAWSAHLDGRTGKARTAFLVGAA